MKEKILLVDDEENLLNVIKDYLLRESYQVYTADRGNKALELFHKIEPDFIILDLMLPDISGHFGRGNMQTYQEGIKCSHLDAFRQKQRG